MPLDWNSTSRDVGPRAAIAVIKLPAKVSITDKRYGGAIVMNPGGPGESGIHQVLTGGRQIQTIVDSPTEGRFFDIISFDPRGVNNTTPRLRCFPDAFAQQAWVLQTPDYGLLWSSPSVIGLEWARAEALGKSCLRADEEAGESMLRYLNTAQVVEDMVELVERLGEFRESEVERILTTTSRVMSAETRNLILQRTRWDKGHEKLKYWGLSYGTLLGQTFAAMHPSRVSRMVIDGVLDAADHYRGSWLANLQDSDKIITQFCQYCFEAGPEKCSLYTGSSASDIESRFEEIMMGLKKSPIGIPGSLDAVRGPTLVTYGDMHLRMLSAMYFSYAYAEDFFALLAEIHAGNTTAIANINDGALQAIELSEECTSAGPFSDACISGNYISGLGATQAIACMDSIGAGAEKMTREAFEEFVEVLVQQSKWISPNWARNKVACVGYDVKPAWTYDGKVYYLQDSRSEDFKIKIQGS